MRNYAITLTSARLVKKRMPIYGIIGIFRDFLAYNNLAKYQYFSMRPSLFDWYYQITYSMQVSAKYFLIKYELYSQKNSKMSQNQLYLCLRFLLSLNH